MDVRFALLTRARLSLMLRAVFLAIALVGNTKAEGDWWSQDWTQDGWWRPQSSAQESPSTSQAGWRQGRATYYGSPHSGSCGYGHLDQSRNTGYNVAAIPDVHSDFHGSCGACYEIKCDPGSFTDYYGETLDRETACYDPEKTVTIAIVDSCPCNGNQRWCCGDMDHFDVFDQVYDQLADRKWGVIGLKYRPVPCPDPSYLERRNHYGDGGRQLKDAPQNYFGEGGRKLKDAPQNYFGEGGRKLKNDPQNDFGDGGR